MNKDQELYELDDEKEPFALIEFKQDEDDELIYYGIFDSYDDVNEEIIENAFQLKLLYYSTLLGYLFDSYGYLFPIFEDIKITDLYSFLEGYIDGAVLYFLNVETEELIQLDEPACLNNDVNSAIVNEIEEITGTIITI